ncbi:MAG: PD40 domain-containing protein [Acidobacteria bacterium]|nr:PD40 domain-containing protein [Acidobacteriota bacterium]
MSDPQTPEVCYHFADVSIDVARQMVHVGGKPVDLEPKVFRLLVFLIENRHRVISKDELVDSVWKGVAVTDNALTRSVVKLRRALGDDARQSRYIQTIPTVGYRFVAELLACEPALPAPANSQAPLPRVRAGTRRVIWAIAAASLVALVAAALLLPRWTDGSPPARDRVLLQPRQLTTGTGLDAQPSLSPAGAEVVYVSDRTGQLELFVRQLLTGSEDIQVTHQSGGSVNPAWSGDGKFIAYHSLARGGIWVVPYLGGEARQIATFGSAPVWSPDGKWIAFRSASSVSMATGDILPSAESTIWIVPASGGAPRRITTTGAVPGKHTTPAWSPDGRSVAFASYLPSSATTALWAVDVRSGVCRRLADESLDCMWPRFLPKGDVIAGCEEQGQFTIRRFKGLKGPGETLMMLGLASPNGITLAADGKSIAWSTAAVAGQLWSVSIDPRTGLPRGAAERLTQNSELRNTTPAISPDGQQVAYWARHRGVLNNLVLLSLGTGQVRVLASDPADFYFSNWLASGTDLAFPSYTGGKGFMVSMSISGGAGKKLSSLPSGAELPRLSPDGRQVAFQRQSDGVMNVWKMDVSTGKETQLTFDREGIGLGTWSQDGTLLSVQLSRDRSTQVGVISADGGKVEQVTRQEGYAWPFSFLPDNDRVTYTAMRRGAWNVYWTSRTTGRTEQITSFSSLASLVFYPSWSPRGDRVVFEHGVNQSNIFFARIP